MRYLAGAAVIGVTALALLAPSAFGAGATPSAIYKDYADNGRLDGKYTTAELDQALKSAVLQGYGSPNVTTGLKPAIQQQQTAGAAATLGGLPFTGLDLTFMALGGALLLLLGAGLRRFARSNG